MRTRGCVIGLAAMLTVAAAAWGQAQKPAGRVKMLGQKPRLIRPSQTHRQRLGTFDRNKSRGIQTRSDQLEAILRSTQSSRIGSRYSSATQITTPIETVLNDQNLLRLRSPLAKKGVPGSNLADEAEEFDPELAGLYFPMSAEADEATVEELGESAAGEFETLANGGMRPNAGTALSDGIAGRVETLADEYYKLGAAYLRKGELMRAESYFRMDKEVHRHLARPFVAETLLAFEARNMNRAYFALTSAFRRCTTLDDLKVDREIFFKDSRGFERSLNSLTVMAGQYPDQPAYNALLSFYSWIGGDLAAARAAGKAAAKIATAGQGGAEIQKFADLLEGASAESAASPGEGPTLSSTIRRN